MPISEVRKICEPLHALRLTEAHQGGHRLMDVAAPIALGMLSEMT
jgi:hypothetical protein